MKKHKLDNYYLKKYNITWKDRMVMWKAQKGRCAICCKHERHFTKRLAVDHDHKTKKVRGLLCFRCNKFLVGRHTVWTAFCVYNYLSGNMTYENIVSKP